jgi:hypothetical protein
MNPSTKTTTLAALAGLVITTASASAANVIVNGDFETGDLTGWTLGGSATSIDSTTPLAGSHSALQVNGGGAIFQSFTAFTGAATTSFIFAASDPGGDGDRSMNVTFGESASTNQINLRLVDDNADGDGDVQAYNGTWTTVLSNAVTFGDTTTFSMTINDYGAGFSYDLNVGGNIASGLTDVQDGVLNDFDQLAFATASLASGSTFEFDNVSVEAVPEPSTTALIGLGGLALILRRRK